jgi:putative ABC transport system permease protein
LLLLFSAFFNFLNLCLGLFRQRIHELRQRMVSGASSGQIIVQMMFELTCTVLIALALAWCFVVLALPMFSGLLNIMTETSRLMQQFVVCGILVITLMLFAGFIPMWRLSRLALRDLTKRKPAGQQGQRT